MTFPLVSKLAPFNPVLKTGASNLLGLAFAIVPLFSFSNSVIQPPGDERKFETLVLPNELKVLLVSDPNTEKSAASMDVWVGSGNDPEDRPGLAHFLEHMLFLGTEKYPTAGEYQDFISGHGGEHNAYTSLNHTNYFFDVKNKNFEQALDRFAQFFISPLFDEKYVERERNAVHSEFSAKTKDDYRRQRDAFSELVIKTHPLSHFTVGNLDTLAVDKPRPLRQDLVDFYNRYYSSNRMALVLVSNQDIAELRKLAKKTFSQVENRKVKPFALIEELFDKDFLPARLSVKPVREERSVSFSFPVPESKAFYTSKPLGFISFFIGHEGKGSLLSALKSANWATGLSSGLSSRWSGGEVFSVSVNLTEEGLEHIPEIRKLMFDYVALLGEKGIEKWRFNEIAAVEGAKFQYGDKIDPIRQASYLASYLHEVPSQDLLRYSYLYSEYKPELIKRYLSYIAPSNLFETLVAPSVKTDRSSHYYSTPYSVQKLDDEFFKPADNSTTQLGELKQQLHLPSKNKFVPNRFKIVGKKTGSGSQDLPVKLKAPQNSEIWFANDNSFDLPKGMLNVRYKLPFVEQGPEQMAAAKILSAVMKEALVEEAYSANMAGLGYGVSATTRGIDFSFSGFDDSLGELVDVVFRSFRKYQSSKKFRDKVNAEHFERVKVELIRAQRNVRHATPYQQVMREIPNFLYLPFWSVEDLTEVYQDMTLEEYSAVVDKLFNDAYAKVFVFGNYSEREAKKLSKPLTSLLPRKADENASVGKVVNLSKKSAQYWHSFPVDHKDNVLSMYIQGKDDSIEEHARMQLVTHILSAPFYTALRTERQLGYIVFSFDYPVRKVPGLVLLIQSPTHSSVQLEQEISRFLKGAGAELFDSFERDRAALVAKLREKPKNQAEIKNRFWGSITNDDYSFDERERVAEAVSKIDLDTIKKYFDYLISEQASRFVIATKADKTELPSDAILLNDYIEFKSKMPTYDYP